MSRARHATVALPGLTPGRAAQLEARWGDGGLWADVEWLAARFWAASGHEAHAVSWHHLVLAVGNFKRQPGRRLRPAVLIELPKSVGTPRASLTTPAGDLHRDERETWERLAGHMRGAGVATTTTLLSALWPDDHFVFDWRVHAAANGLRLSGGLEACPSLAGEQGSRRPAPLSFDDYVVVRDWMRTVDCRLVTVERALYLLSQQVPAVVGRSWDDYGKAVAAKLAGIPE